MWIDSHTHTCTKGDKPQIPPHWCAVPELVSANWTVQQIKEISSASNCLVYNYDYTYFAQVGYENATEYIKTLTILPVTTSCSQYYYEDIGGSTVVEEWNLVCDRAADRANTYMALSLGKLIGAGFFGVFADRHGRKTTYVIGIFMLIIAGPLTAFVPWFWAFLVLRFFTGVSLSAIGYSSMTTLTEASSSKHRQWMGIAFNTGYPIGMAMLSGLAYLARDWKHLQLIVSLPSLILLFHAWFMPESPRWLLSQNRRKQAHRVVRQYYEPLESETRGKNSSDANSREIVEKKSVSNVNLADQGCVRNNLKSLKILYSNSDLRKRAFIMYFSWMTSSLCYYVIALNVDNFSVDHYTYMLIMGLTEVPAYLVPSGILMMIGRRQSGALLYTIGGVCLLSILAISRDNTVAIMLVALTGRFALSAVYGIIILYTSELFPTIVRNSAVGTSSVMAHVGTITAPYVADLVGQAFWWAPSTLCGILAVIAGISCLVLPETRDRSLADTVEEETAKGRGRVSLAQICSN
ncbi:organic cation transporter protein-like isoform X2 [Venturia canescens]|uniref:organic cation transporter protein-like isoform X2 n=1 Tax=Venturia canescens TaxID=32260 RepID=UPI001C9C0C54|nr:organic cation transporter protein-like isoform X2 [Venturia canescens]